MIGPSGTEASERRLRRDDGTHFLEETTTVKTTKHTYISINKQTRHIQITNKHTNLVLKRPCTTNASKMSTVAWMNKPLKHSTSLSGNQKLAFQDA